MKKENFVAAIIIARNEEKIISKTIESLRTQILLPYRIIVVNDGSIDKTAEIVSKFTDVELITLSKTHESYLGRKELAEIFNIGLKKLENDHNCEFILIMGADQILPQNYLSEIVKRIIFNKKIVIASGVAKKKYITVPSGGGRVVRYDFWKKLNLKYPTNYGFEGYLVWKALSMGYKTSVFADLETTIQRKAGTLYNLKVYYYYGLALKALGYSIPYALGRILLFSKRTPKGSYYMLKGFFSNYDVLYEKELRDFVKQTQRHELLKFKHLKKIFQ